MTLILANVTLIDDDGVEPGAAIQIVDGRIAAIGTTGDFGADPGYPVVDGTGHWVLPGLIDVHVHLALDATPHALLAPRAPDDPEVWRIACQNARLLVQSGVTTAVDCGSHGDLGVRLREAFATGRALGPRLLVSGPVLTVEGGHGAWFGRVASDSPQIVDAARALLESGVDLIKVMASGGGTPGATAPWDACFSVSTLSALVAFAEDHGLPVVAHARSVAAIRACAEAGVHRIEHLTFETGPGAVAFDEASVRTMQTRGIWADPTLPAGRRAVQSTETDEERRRQLECAFALRDPNYRRMAEMGLRLLAGSDAGTPLVTFDDFALGPELLVEICGFSPMDAIRAATSWSALAVGMSDEVGRLRPGMVADLVLVGSDPLDDIRALRDVVAVMKAGEWLFRREGHEVAQFPAQRKS